MQAENFTINVSFIPFSFNNVYNKALFSFNT